MISRKSWFVATVGAIIYAISVNFFYMPGGLTSGGISGIAMISNRLLGTPVGLVSILLNIPLFILGFWKLGRRFGISSLFGCALSFIATDLFALVPLPEITGTLREDTLLAALCGGALMGVGLGLVFAAGGTTGGSDIIVSLVNRRWPRLSMGRLILLTDFAVISAGGLVCRDVPGILYSLVGLVVSSYAVDAVLYGVGRGTAAFIITDKPEEVKQMIFDRFSRGVTEVRAAGGYTGAGRTLLLCAVNRREGAELRPMVMKTDPSAFVILTDAREVRGEGFDGMI